METKDLIFDLRTRLRLSQDDFAAQLFVTRQAVSRWETGETVPSIDTLKRITETFHVSVDHLLGHPAGQCQSCGMELQVAADLGTEADGSPAEDYCAFCYRQGVFTAPTLEEMVEHNLQTLDEWNRAAGTHFTREEARAQLLAFLLTLKRWKT